MVINLSSLAPLVMTLLPVILGSLSPMLTDLVKKVVGGLGNKVPAPLKPVINTVIGALVAGLTGGNPVAGMVGAHVGNRVREAIP